MKSIIEAGPAFRFNSTLTYIEVGLSSTFTYMFAYNLMTNHVS